MPKLKKVVPSVSSPIYSNKLILILLIFVSLLSFYTFFKVRNLEQKIVAGSPTATGQQAASPLSTDNLKKYAKELGLNTGKFNSCLDKDVKKAAVTADQSYGSSIGVQGTPGFFINGRFLAGAFPFQLFQEIIDKEIAGQGSNNCADYSADLQKYCQDPKNQPFNPVVKAVDVGNAPVTGNTNAKVTIVEFSDFQCPYCIRAYPTTQQILKTYGNQVKFYYRQFPLTQIHPFAQKTAEASLCAQDQGKFWQYHDKIFSVQSQ